MERLNFILALIGALAWIPTLFMLFIRYISKINCKILDMQVLTDAKNKKAFSNEEYKGTILLLCVNLYTSGKEYFSLKTTATIYTKNNKFNSWLLQYSNTQSIEPDGTIVNFIVPEDKDYSKDMLIKSNCSNIKYLALFIPDSNIRTENEIIKVKFYLNNGSIFRKIIVDNSDYGSGKVRMIDQTKVVTKK